MPETAKFCTNCGAKLPERQSVQAAPAAAYAAPAAAAPAPVRKKKKKHVFLTILLILIALSIAFGVFLVSLLPLYRFSRISVDIRDFPDTAPAFTGFAETMDSGWLLVDDTGSEEVYSFLSEETGLGWEDMTAFDLKAAYGGGLTVRVDTTSRYAYYIVKDPESYDTLTIVFEKATLGEKMHFLSLYLK